ncbi:MAG: SUF system Fe-S cluster assembly regulator [Acidobacteriota bacterium]
MMRLTKQADYGIVLLSHMSEAPGRRFSAPDLAAETQIPLPTVSKVLKLLVRGKLLTSQRGAKGGYILSKAPQGITVAEMISALEGPIAFTECIEDAPGSCSQEAFCSLRGSWQRINEALRQALQDITLADIRQPSAPLVQLGAGRHSR